MKRTDTIDQVISKLAELKNTEQDDSVVLSEEVSIRRLAALFEEAKNHESEETAKELFIQAGYGWVGELDQNEVQAMAELSNFKNDELFHIQQTSTRTSQAHIQFSEEEFMNLIPVNAYFH